MAEENSEKTIKAEQDNQSSRFTLFDGQPEREQPSTVLDGQYALFEDPAEQQAFAATLVNDIAPDLPQPTGTATDKVGDFFSDFANAFESQVKDVDAERAEAHFKDKQERLLQRISELRDFIQSPDFKRLENTFSDFEDWISAVSPQWSMADFLFFASNDLLKSLLPFVLDEVDELKKTPGMESLTLTEFMRNIDGNGRSIQSHFDRALNKAIERRGAQKQEEENIPRIKSLIPKNIEYAIDKINNNVWNFFESAQTNGQLQFATERRGSTKEATVLYSIDFSALEDELGILKKLTPFDKRVYIACAALYNSYSNARNVNLQQREQEQQPLCFSVSQIYSAMGNKRRPASTDLEKINASLTKMRAATVYVDNTQENAVNKNYDVFKYDGSLLPFERCSGYVDNQFSDALVHLFRDPPLIAFAKSRHQITTLPDGLLCSPISKTDENLRIDDYLITRISQMKNGKNEKISKKILFATIFEKCGITEKKQKQRAPEKIRRYLNYYVERKFIKGYSESKDGITILL